MITKERFQEILNLAGEEDKIKLRFLHKACLSNLQAYKRKYTTANLNNWKSAEKELNDLCDQVTADGGDDMDISSTSFPNRSKVLVWLKRNGWKIAQSTFYKHVKAGFIKPDSKGRFLMPAVENYAARYLKRADGSHQEEAKDQKDKRKAEIRKSTAQAVHWELKSKIESGLYVPRENFERQLAARARVLKSDLLSFCRSQAPEIIEQVNGDPELAPDLVQFMVNRVETFLDRYTHDADSVNLDN